MKTEEFIDILEDRGLVPPRVTRQLRAKVAEGVSRITADSILKYLVKKELITRRQAKELLRTTLVVTDKTESSILGLVPLPDVDHETPSKRSRPAPAAVEDDEPPVPLKPLLKAKAPPATPKSREAAAAAPAKTPMPAADDLFV